ncbi:LPS export ABC transporter periplasmic protein LptC [Pararhizobium haloflavum]|uniref:LPS export ABC transporter periplasmic protein LptC n=1 Tax=Pararhizobium haloflavum TaxID=2037914 RepID=UPI000C18B0AF|nr:LPS export ABC transporter periplasmic protein LptC [Pararhizobium haloflavum]
MRSGRLAQYLIMTASGPETKQTHPTMASVEHQMGQSGRFAGRSAVQYQRALRHSQRVVMLKWLFPALTVLVVGALVAVSLLSRALPDNVTVERASISDGTIIMENPVLTGQTGDAQTFTVNAFRALQSVGSPNLITLNAISAELPVSTTQTAKVEAESGLYDRTAETLTLDAPFRIKSSDGLEVEMQSAAFDLAAGEMRSDAPITLRNGNTSLVAQSVRIRDNGETIRFTRDVRMTIDPSTLRNSQKDGEHNGD